MRLPARRLEIARTFEGRTSDAGWLVIDLRGLDLEGETKLCIDMDQVARIERQHDEARERLAELFGGCDDDDLM
jgi:hypothetical protein